MLKTFVFLATLYTSDGPVIYVLDTQLTGADCIARLEQGVTQADYLAIIDERVGPSPEAHVPTNNFVLERDQLIASCEMEW